MISSWNNTSTKENSGGVSIKSLKRAWKELLLAAQAFVATENSTEVSIISRDSGQRAVLTFGCPWSHSSCWLLHAWNIHKPDPSSLQGAVAAGGGWPQDWRSAPHRDIIYLPVYHGYV